MSAYPIDREPEGLENSQSKLLLFKALYFIYFGSCGVLLPTMPVFFDISCSFSKYQIGVLSMIPNIASFVFSPLVAVFADRNPSWHTEIFICCLLISTAITSGLMVTKSYALVAFLVIVISIARSPLVPMLDARTIGQLVDKNRYGEIRLYGAASFGILVLLTGMIIDTEHDNNNEGSVAIQGFKYAFYIHIFLCLLTGIVVIFYCVFTGVETSDSKKVAEQEITPHNSSNDNSSGTSNTLLELLRQKPEVVVFILIVFFSGLGDGVIDAFLFLRIKELGGSGAIMGIGRFITCVAEVPMFQIAGRLQQRFGTYPLLAFTQLAFVMRFSAYAMLTKPWWVLPCEALNGFTFAVTWSASCAYAQEISPKGTETTMQSVLESVHFGLGCGLGALIGGIVYDRVGSVKLFWGSAILSMLSMFLALYQSIVTYSMKKKKNDNIISMSFNVPLRVDEEGNNNHLNKTTSASGHVSLPLDDDPEDGA